MGAQVKKLTFYGGKCSFAASGSLNVQNINNIVQS